MDRRQFNRLMSAAAGQAMLLLGPLGPLVRSGWAGLRRRLLASDTDLGTLLYENPDDLDASQLPLTPIEDFGTMGTTDHVVDLEAWRLEIGGAVAEPQRLSYADIQALPAVERRVLLICPGVFAYHALWKGISLGALLAGAGISKDAARVDISGPEGPEERFEVFALDEVRTDRVFLAYAVNGRPLPQPHGFPLRVVAEGQVGSRWVKYVDRVDVSTEEAPPPLRPETPGPAFLP